MKRFLIALAITAVAGGAAAAIAHEGHKQVPAKAPVAVPAKAKLSAATEVEKVQLTGELIDPQCWFTHNGEGKGHVECAVTCAEGGQDLAFLDQRTGQMYTLIATGHGNNPNVGLYQHVGVPVKVRGTAYQRGANRGLIIEAVEKVR